MWHCYRINLILVSISLELRCRMGLLIKTLRRLKHLNSIRNLTIIKVIVILILRIINNLAVEAQQLRKIFVVMKNVAANNKKVAITRRSHPSVKINNLLLIIVCSLKPWITQRSKTIIIQEDIIIITINIRIVAVSQAHQSLIWNTSFKINRWTIAITINKILLIKCKTVKYTGMIFRIILRSLFNVPLYLVWGIPCMNSIFIRIE